MTRKVTLDESIKVNLDSETYTEIEEKANKKGLSKSAMARTILIEQVKN